jgi:hypothetical protein
MNPDSSLQALYYPYADVRSSQALLEACLYFDRVYILEPNFFRPPMDGNLAGERVPYEAGMAPLVEAGVIEPIGPALLGFSSTGRPLLDEDNLELVRASIEQDLADRQLTRLAVGKAPSSWTIPTGQQLFWNGLHLLLERPHSRISVLTERADYYRAWMRSKRYHVAQMEPPGERRWRGSDELQVDVPWLEAESLIITVVLLACSELGLCPITDSPLHEEFLRQKLGRMYRDPGLRDAVRPLLPAIRESDIGLHSLSLAVPRIDVQDAATVLMIRRQCAESLERFRGHFRMLGYKVATQPWSPEFQDEITRLIRLEVEPALADLRDQLDQASKNLGLRLITNIAQAAPLPLVLTLATGVPPAIALAAGAGAAAVNSLAQYLLDRGPLQRHGLYFLLKAGDWKRNTGGFASSP